MPVNRYTQQRRTRRQVQADARADRLAGFLGKALKAGREQLHARQADVSAIAGLSQSCWSELECGTGANVSLRVWMRAADAVGSDVRAYLERLPGTEAPRDAVHLGIQELLAATAAPGGWLLNTEQLLAGAGVADLLLARDRARALMEIWTWLADVGEAFRSWDRKLERLREAGSPVSGCWVLRATRKNKALVAAHRTLFNARFPGSAERWIKALMNAEAPMPEKPGLLWVSVRGDRLFASRGPRMRP